MIKKYLVLFSLIAFINLTLCPLTFAKEVILESGTKIRLKLADNISSKVNNEGDNVNFIVSDDVKVDDVVVIKEGTRVPGLISELIPRGRIGKAGKLSLTLDEVKAINGKKIPLTGSVSKKGDDKTTLTLGLGVGLGIFMPIALLFLLMKGTDAQLPAGYQVIAKVDRDVTLALDDNIYPVSNVRLQLKHN